MITFLLQCMEVVFLVLEEQKTRFKNRVRQNISSAIPSIYVVADEQLLPSSTISSSY